MPKYKTERIILDGSIKKELDFKVDVYIDQDGFFTATLPVEITDLFKERGIKLTSNGRRNGRLGFYSSATYFKLISDIEFSCKEYVSRELVRESIVIRYVIETTCTYLIDDEKQIVPNGHWVKGYGDEGKNWREGTESQHAASPHPFGVRIYAKPFYKKEYRYKSGTEKTEYKNLYEDDCLESQPHLKWIAGVCSVREPKGEVREIEYTEKTAYFFETFYKTLCSLNEKLKDFVDPESLMELIDKKFPMLTFNEPVS